MGLIPQLTDAGKAMMIKAMTGSNLNFTAIKIGDANAPSTLKSGDYWYDTENQTLNQYMDTWTESTTGITVENSAPADPEIGDLWYNPTTGALYKCTNGWVLENEANLTCATSAPENPNVGDHWYDTANNIFHVRSRLWSNVTGVRMSVRAEAPTNPSIGGYWYDTTSEKLKICSGAWQDTVISVSDEAPAEPSIGDYWYDTTNSVLKVCTSTDEEAVWSGAGKNCPQTLPESPSFGDVWCDLDRSVIQEYIAVWAEDTTHNFTYSQTVPSDPQEGDWWYDTALHIYEQQWTRDTSRAFTYGAVAPTTAKEDDWWYSTTNSTLYTYGRVMTLDDVDTLEYGALRPAIAYGGDYWYDTGRSVLMEYASGWFVVEDINFTYGASPAGTPSAGDWWYNSTSNTLYEHNGAQWIVNYASITCSISQPNTAESLTDILNPILTAPITEILKGSNYVSLTVQLSNAELLEGFKWSETGVFAQIDGGEPELYAYCNAGELCDYIPANTSGRLMNETFTLLVMIGDAENVSATIGEASIYASKAALDDHIRNGENPHNVTKKQLGLENVENKAPSNMTVTFEEAKTLEEIKTDEKLSSLFGKIKKAINTLILHLKAENPHGITPEKIKAADATHNHKASDINEGTLSVDRGGTGVSSLVDLKRMLEAIVTKGYITTSNRNQFFAYHFTGYDMNNASGYDWTFANINVDTSDSHNYFTALQNCKVKVYYSVSLEQNYDFLNLYVNGVQKARATYNASSTVEFTLTKGQQFYFNLHKDINQSQAIHGETNTASVTIYVETT